MTKTVSLTLPAGLYLLILYASSAPKNAGYVLLDAYDTTGGYTINQTLCNDASGQSFGFGAQGVYWLVATTQREIHMRVAQICDDSLAITCSMQAIKLRDYY